MNRIMYSMGFMLLITLAFTSLVSLVRYANEERILRNQQVKLQETILKVLGIGVHGTLTSKDILHLFERRVKPLKVQNKHFYLGYDADGETIRGYAFPVGGPGFWGPIYGMAAVDADASKMLGLAFYRHSETPGLGGRISEAWFTQQFVGLPVYPMEGNQKIFYLTPKKIGKAPNELDAITGASGTSRAVEHFLNQELDRFLMQVWKAEGGRLKADGGREKGEN